MGAMALILAGLYLLHWELAGIESAAPPPTVAPPTPTPDPVAARNAHFENRKWKKWQPTPTRRAMPTMRPTPTREPLQYVSEGRVSPLPRWVRHHYPLVRELWIGHPDPDETTWPVMTATHEGQSYEGEIGGYAIFFEGIIAINPKYKYRFSSWHPGCPSDTFVHEYAHLRDDRPHALDRHDAHFQELLAEEQARSAPLRKELCPEALRWWRR